MNITKDQILAAGRHVVTFAMGAVTMAAAGGALTSGQADSAGNAITQISNGVASIVIGVSTLVAIASGVWATLSASPLWQLFAAAKNPNVQKIVAPQIADQVPSDKVVAK